MIYKITLSISGDNFFPSKSKKYLVGAFLDVGSFDPSDKKDHDKEILDDFGSISVWNPKKFTLQKNVLEYEKFFVEFLVQNYQLLIENGATDFTIYYEVYHKDDQCNFEIFDAAALKKLAQLNLFIPVSTYRLKKKQYRKWAKEIKLLWKKKKQMIF